jgi:hypothetical protein
MDEDAVHEQIAFIRRAIEEGRGFIGARSPDMLVWGVAIAAGYLATYASVRGWWQVPAGAIWTACIVPPWLYSLRATLGRQKPGPAPRPLPSLARAMQMVWFGCGICLTSLAVILLLTGEMRRGWFEGVSAGILGVAFFASAALCGLAWMRWVAIGWWLGQAALLTLQGQPEVLSVSAVLTLALLALPGAALLAGRA